MDQIALNQERRRHLALERLGSDWPACECGQADWRCLQLIPARADDGDSDPSIICRNCRKKQRAIPESTRKGAGGAFCILCAEDDPSCLERHHIAGRAFSDVCVTVCGNCHAKISEMQKDHRQ
jgi:hypothetical protein